MVPFSKSLLRVVGHDWIKEMRGLKIGDRRGYQNNDLEGLKGMGNV